MTATTTENIASEIRRGTVEDYDAVRSIYQKLVHGHLDDDYYRRLIASGGIVVAVENQQVVGFGGIDIKAEEQLKWLYLLPEYQGGRRGSRLLSELENVGRDHGLTTLKVHAAPGAEGFYLRHDYEPVTPAEKSGHDHDGMELFKRLAFPSPSDGDKTRSLEERIAAALCEEVSIVSYDAAWPDSYAREAEFLWSTLPQTIVKRIEHFGSTAVPGLAAKPIVDLLVEVTSFKETKELIVPLLEGHGYDYFWRTDVKVPYPWFIKRNEQGKRTHHIHMVKADSKWWDRLYFRDYLKLFPDEALRYEALKRTLAQNYPNDRKAYTDGKSEFIVKLTEKAKDYFSGPPPNQFTLPKNS